MPYIGNTEQDRKEMLDVIGVSNIEELWEKAGVLRAKPPLSRMPRGRSEYEVTQYLMGLGKKNVDKITYFLGGGYYDHSIPAVVAEITGRGEFSTAYTPYQPEASQGTLQAMYEYQSLICRLTNMEVANASLYDGGSALFEAMMMGKRINGKKHVVFAGTVSPIYTKMIQCYSQNLDISFSVSDVSSHSNKTDIDALYSLVSKETSCIIVQYPNFFGALEDWRELNEYAHQRNIITICSTYPVALSLCTPPGDVGFDIVTGEGQSLGLPLSFGGPYLGFMASRRRYVRKMPGRIVGRTEDMAGKEGFVLTLQAREQHIRREKATSNICTNQSLCALAATVYMASIGKEGFVALGELCAAKAAFTKECLLTIPGVQEIEKDDHFFNEFVLRLPTDAAEIVGLMIDKGFALGFPLGRYFPKRNQDILIAVTEKRTREDIQSLAIALESILYCKHPPVGHPPVGSIFRNNT